MNDKELNYKESVLAIVGDNYYPCLSLQELYKKFNRELVFIEFSRDYLWIPGTKKVQSWKSKKTNMEERPYKMMSFNHQSIDDKYITIYFDNTTPNELIISRSSLDRNEELKTKSSDMIFAELGLGDNWIITSEIFLQDIVGLQASLRPVLSDKAKEVSERAKQLLQTKTTLQTNLDKISKFEPTAWLTYWIDWHKRSIEYLEKGLEAFK